MIGDEVGNGTPPQYFCLENSMGRENSVGRLPMNPWGLKKSDMTERLNTHAHTHTHTHTHTRTRAHTHTCTHACVHACTHTHMHTCTHAEGSIRGTVLIPLLLKGILVPEDTGPLSWEAHRDQREGITGIPARVPVTHSSLQKSCAHT